MSSPPLFDPSRQPSPPAFGPPPWTLGPRWSPPSGPTLEILPEGGGAFAAKYLALAGYLSALAGTALVAVNTLVGRGDHEVAVWAGMALLFGGVTVYALAAMTWVYQSWRYLPPPYRRTASGREVTPGWALVGHLVPFYNLYWMFAQSLGYCEALDSVMVQSGRSARAPKTLATVACVVQLVPYVSHLVGPILWLAYMFLTDRVKAQLAAPRAG